MASKLASKDVAFKTKWKAEKSMTGNCATPPLPGGLSYVIIPCTFDPGSQASFEMLVSSDDPFTLEPLPTATAAKATTALLAQTARRSGVDRFLDQRVPAPALLAFARPARVGRTAVLADVVGAGAGHQSRPRRKACSGSKPLSSS